MKSKRRPKQLAASASEATWERVRRAAEREDISMAGLLRRGALREAERILSEGEDDV